MYQAQTLTIIYFCHFCIQNTVGTGTLNQNNKLVNSCPALGFLTFKKNNLYAVSIRH